MRIPDRRQSGSGRCLLNLLCLRSGDLFSFLGGFFMQHMARSFCRYYTINHPLYIKRHEDEKAGMLANSYSLVDNSRYDYSKPFAEQVNDLKKKQFPPRDALLMGKTNTIMKNIGMAPLPMTLNQKHANLMLDDTSDPDHSLGEQFLKSLPSILEKPIAVISSQSNPQNSLVFIVEYIHNGKPVVAPIYIEGLSRQNKIEIDANAVTGSHAKGNAVSKLLSDALIEEEKGNVSVFYINKKEAQSLPHRAGVPMPWGSVGDGLIHNINDEGSPVKTSI